MKCPACANEDTKVIDSRVASDGLSPYGILKKLPGEGHVTITVLQLVSLEEQGPVKDFLIRNLRPNPSFAVSFARPLEERVDHPEKNI